MGTPSDSRFQFKSDSIQHRLRALTRNPPERRDYWWDSTREGFGFRYSPNCTGTYVYRYRHIGKQRVLTLGAFDKFSEALDEYKNAVAEVTRVRRIRAKGGEALDPIDTRRQERGKDRAIAASIKVADAVDLFLEDRKRTAELRRKGKGAAGKGLRDSTASQYGWLFKADVIPAIGNRPLRSIRAADIAAVCDRANKRDAAATAARLHNAIGSLFTWAVERGICERNPAREKGIPQYYLPAHRTRVLSDAEITALFNYAGDAPSTPWLSLFLTLATGQRSGELLKLRQSDVQGDVLVIPAEVAKTGKPHRVPLSPLAQEIVSQLQLRAGKSIWLVPGKHPRESMQQQTLGITIRRALPTEDDRRGTRQRRTLPVTFAPHDLRRTARTQMSALGVPEFIAELILAHEIHSVVAKSYAHHSFQKEMRDALNLWSDKLCALRGRHAEPSNVIAFPRIVNE